MKSQVHIRPIRKEEEATISTEARLIEMVRLTQKLYKANRRIRPLYPWVLVWVCDREQKIGRVVVPDIEQNKPVHEGIVLATWAPFTQERGIRAGEINVPYLGEAVGLTGPVKAGATFTRTIERRSQFEPGQRVIFPHWAGMPIHGLDDKRYRVVRECDWKESEQGGIFAVVDYDEPDTKPVEVARDLIEAALNAVGEEEKIANVAALIADQLADRFVLVDRKVQSVTLSGR